MDIRALKNNVIDCFKTTRSLKDGVRKLNWIYNIKPGKEYNIKFNYPAPIGKFDLTVRSNNGSDAFIVSEVFNQQCYQVSQNKPINSILDLGANAGFTAVYFSRLFPKAKIVCVEPMPNNIQVLKKNLAANNVNASIKQAAIATDDGYLQMEISSNDYGHKVHDIAFGKSVGDSLVDVEAISINSLLKELKWTSIDLLKIDIEGYEGLLFKSNIEWLEVTDTIIIEIHENISVEEFSDHLAGYAFQYRLHRKGNWIFSKHIIE